MNEVVNFLGPFAWGFVVGYFWYPLWAIGKKIVQEARKAKQEWSKPNGS